ncbi:hypothetical protein ACHAWF_014403 [Thalassiosira exigua]
MAWEPPPLHRHLSTIGIGPVFVRPPPHFLPSEPSEDAPRTGDGVKVSTGPGGGDGAGGGEPSSPPVVTWEIVGDIKSAPEDFVVREIGWAPASAGAKQGEDELNSCGANDEAEYTTSEYRRKPGWSRSTAGEWNFEAARDLIASPNPKQNEVQSSKRPQTPFESHPTPTEEKAQHQDEITSNVDPNPLEGLRRLLVQCYQCSEAETSDNWSDDQNLPNEKESAADGLLQQLADLQREALEEIRSASSASSNGGSVETDENANSNRKELWIPTHSLNGKEDLRLLHRYVREAFYLLRTERSSADPSDNGRADGVRVAVDDTYFSLIPFLYNSLEDLSLLYKFRNEGPPSLGEHEGKNLNARKCPAREDVSKLVQLRLLPGIPRTERSRIHHIIASSRRRDLDTSTKNDVPLEQGSNKTTTAIEVRWSFKSKRKRTGRAANRRGINGHPPEKRAKITAIFCVLRKEQVEHHVAVSHLARALRCRSGDVGVAGIKDMMAITYQFITIRNVDMKRAQDAKSSLGTQVQLSNFAGVEDFLLDRGKLLGNRFEITIRNLKRIEQLHVDDGEGRCWKERAIPLTSSHLDAMATRIRDHGFVNFYGSQRLGDAGFRSAVGVHTFDVGRAMLQKDFSKAIDLIMEGRSKQMYSPGEEEIKARETWSSSGGDARATLKAFPKNPRIMARERDLMKGLLRYGDALEGLRCLPYGVRTFWIHAYQAFVWNRVATERVRRFGLHPVVGDLYQRDDDCSNVEVVMDPESVDISQVVLPLPGHNIQYPENEIGDLYQEVIARDGVNLSVKGNIPEATAKGSYRKLIQKVNGLKWAYDPKGNIVHLSFELKSGCYATMMLREMM